MHSSLNDWFLATAEDAAERQAVVGAGGSYTFGQYAHAALSAARALEERGAGERLALLLPTSEAFAVMYFGTLLSGRVPVPLNFLLSPQELAAIVKDAGVGTVFTAEPFEKLAAALGVESVAVEKWLPEALAGGPAPPREANHVATILYTSGTTGTPKGVVLTQENLLSNIRGCIEHCGFTPQHRLLGILPLFHTFALTTTLVLPAVIGAATVLMPRFEPRSAAQAIAANSITTLMAVPSMYRAMLRAIENVEVDFSSLEMPICGGEPLSQDCFEAWRERHGVTLLEGYGLTETSPVISANTLAAFKAGTVGKPLSNIEVRVSDDSGQDAGVNADGEIWVRGPSVMEGYLNREEETNAAITDTAFFKTGDMGRMDEDGFLKITGRKKDMIISAGENIFPREIEQVLLSHPAVAEAAVVGIPHAQRGEAPKAFVVLSEGHSVGEDDLKDLCREKIARHKVPVTVEFRDEFPRSPMGKILKRRLVAEERRDSEGGR